MSDARPTATDQAPPDDHATAASDRRADRELDVDVADLRLTYGDGTRAVDGVSLAIPEGEFFGFLGPNGAGKTTTIKTLATLLRPTGGSVRVAGHDVTAERTAVRAAIGYMAQETSVDPELTARENLQFACDAYGVDRGRRPDRVAELLDLVDLADVADTPAGQFSGGMAKRLDAATALVHDPELVFLDEPTTGLDPKARNRLWDYFRRINDADTTIFLTTQYLEEADQLCDRLAVIRDGRIVADGAPGELKRRVGGEVLEVGVDGGPDAVEAAARVARESGVFDPDASVDAGDGTVRVTTPTAADDGPDLLVALRDRDLTVTGFDLEQPSLDDVFLAIADDDGELAEPRTTHDPDAAGEREVGP